VAARGTAGGGSVSTRSPAQLTRAQLEAPIRLVALDMDGTLLDDASRM